MGAVHSQQEVALHLCPFLRTSAGIVCHSVCLSQCVSVCVCLSVCLYSVISDCVVCSLSAGAVSSRQSQQPVGAAGNVVSVKSDPTVLPTEFSRSASAPLSKVRQHCLIIVRSKTTLSCHCWVGCVLRQLHCPR